MKQIENIKRVDMRVMLMAVALTALVLSSAHAAERKTEHRTESVVTGSMITLGDVFEGVTENAGYVLAPAPEPGKTKTLNVNDLTRIARAFNLDWEPAGGIAQSVISRDAVEIDRYAIEAALQEKIASMMDGGKFEMTLGDKSLKIFLPPEFAATVEIDDVLLDKTRGEFRAMLSAPSSSNPVVKKEVRGRLQALVSIPVLKSPLRSGDIIGAHDVIYADMPAKSVTSATVVSAEKLIGMTPRRGIAAEKPVALSDLEQPIAVKKGDLVRMTLESGAMILTVQGRALESGAVGETVRVINASSNQVVEGVVNGAQSVSIAPPLNAASNI